jgi:HD-like signal output (HDOD) protein/CheY-like chemotaxis protein
VRGAMQQILICNSKADEARDLSNALRSQYAVKLLHNWDGSSASLDVVDAIVLDSNFTEAHGLDFLMATASTVHVPILLITPPEDPQCAIEARRLGAFNYLVKTPKLPSFLKLALQEMLNSFNDQQELKRTVVSLRRRVSELEQQLNNESRPTLTARPPGDSKRKAAFQEIAQRLQSGQVNLPAYPSIGTRLNALIESGADLKQIAQLVAKDMAIAARLISVANSAAYAHVQRSTNVEQAVNVLGLRLTKEYVDVIANRALYVVQNRKYQPHLLQLWKHAVACANASRLLDEKLNAPLFEMGLLHDVGKLLLIQIVSELDMANALGDGVSQEDIDAFLHLHHVSAGLRLAKLWKLPDSYADIIQYHEAPNEAPTSSRELSIVHLANLLVRQAGFGRYNADTDNAALCVAASELGCGSDKLQEIQDRVRELVEQASFAFD